MEYRVRIGWGDVDFGRVIFWARYFPYIEHAIGEWMISKGATWPDLVLNRGIGMPATHMEVRFVRPARLQEVVVIQLSVKDVSRRGCTFHFAFRRDSDGELLAYGRITRRFIDIHAFRGVELPDDLYQLFVEMERESPGSVDFTEIERALLGARRGDRSGA
ncbi:MAG: thioesterase family protein [Chloroflexota bacterium]|nr:thioesterase family protein [Chloroflexota bacterium]